MKFLGPAAGLLKLLRDISAEDIQRLAELDFVIGVTGPSSADCDALISYLGSAHAEPTVANRSFRKIPWKPSPESFELLENANIIIYLARLGEEIPESELDYLRGAARGLTPLVVLVSGETSVGEKEIALRGPSGVFKKTVVVDRLAVDQVRDRVIPVIIDLLPELAVTLGRRLPPFRQAAATKTILDTSWSNAQFAAFSNLPALIPMVGNVIAATADFFVLTRNQIMLLLKLAAVYGRDLRVTRNVYLEILPVVGAALLWRTAARELVALLPGLLSAVPKVLIAFSGTYVVGQTAAYYYDEGRRPSAAVVRSFYNLSTEKASIVMPELLSNARSLLSRPDPLGDPHDHR